MIAQNVNKGASKHVDARVETRVIDKCREFAVILQILLEHDCVSVYEHSYLSRIFIDYLYFGSSTYLASQFFWSSLTLLDPIKWHHGLDSMPVGVRFELRALLEHIHSENPTIYRSKHILTNKVLLLKNSLKISPHSSSSLSSLRSIYMSRLGSYRKASRISCTRDLLHPSSLKFPGKKHVGLSHYAFGHQCHNFDLFTKVLPRDIQSQYCLSVIPGYSGNTFLELLNRTHASSLGIEVSLSTDIDFYLELILGDKYENDSHCLLNSQSHWYPVALSITNIDSFNDERYHAHINLRMTLLSGLDACAYAELYRAKHNLRNYVTIYYRSEGYKQEATHPYNMFRNSSPDLILQYIKKLNDLGFCVVLLGDSSQKTFDYKNTLFLDYSHSSHKNDVNDIDLVANAMACISGFGGGFYLPYMFDRPTLLIDWPMTFKPIWAPFVRVVPRRMKLFDGNEIGIDEFFTVPFNFLEDGQVLYEHGVHVGPNYYSSDSTVGRILELFFDELSNPLLMSSESVEWAYWGKKWGYDYPMAVPVARVTQ